MANVVTCVRILSAFMLLFCPVFSGRFDLFYLIGGVSDVLDGFIARHWGKETPLGARLDTAADIVFTVIVWVRIISAVDFPPWLIVWIILIALIRCVNIITGIVVSGHFVAEYTAMNKICGVLLFVLPFPIRRFPRRLTGILILLSCLMATFAALQEGYYIRNGKEIR